VKANVQGARLHEYLFALRHHQNDYRDYGDHPVAALGAVSWVISNSIETRSRNRPLPARTPAYGRRPLHRTRSPRTKVTWGKDGNVARIEMESIPTEFTDHTMIDTIGRMTGQTARSRLGSQSKDFWRRHHQHHQAGRKPCVGTALGQKGAVYPFVTRAGLSRRGRDPGNVLLHTIYQPIFSPTGDVIGILYAGVRKAESTASRPR